MQATGRQPAALYPGHDCPVCPRLAAFRTASRTFVQQGTGPSKASAGDRAGIGDEALKVYALYAPPEHPHGTVHATKEEADAAEE